MCIRKDSLHSRQSSGTGANWRILPLSSCNLNHSAKATGVSGWCVNSSATLPSGYRTKHDRTQKSLNVDAAAATFSPPLLDRVDDGAVDDADRSRSRKGFVGSLNSQLYGDVRNDTSLTAAFMDLHNMEQLSRCATYEASPHQNSD